MALVGSSGTRNILSSNHMVLVMKIVKWWAVVARETLCQAIV